MATMRLRHVIPTVGPSAPDRLVAAQLRTLDSIERALRLADGRVEVDVVAARFPDEPPPERPWLRDAPVLRTSSADLGEFRVARRLPLLREVLSALGEGSDHEAFIYTNIDIHLQPAFYEIVADIVDAGYDAFTINRRSVAASFGADRPALTAAGVGAAHPGSDCFVMTPALASTVDVGDVLLGVRSVGRTLLEDLAPRARRFRRFADLHATFHVGDDRPWDSEELEDYAQFNLDQRLAAVSRRGSTTERGGVRPWPQLIVAACTARSGTRFLAQLLDSVPGVSAAHERAPALNGPWLEEVAAEGLAATYEARMAKVRALHVEMSAAQPCAAFADISHLFLTSQHDVILDAFDHSRLKVIDLRRDPAAIAASMASLGYFTDRNDRWPAWLLDPSRLRAGSDIEAGELTGPLDRVFAHLAEVMARRDDVRSAAPTVDWIRVDLPDLLRPKGALGLLERLGLKAPDRYWPPRRLLRRVNERAAVKRRMGTSVSYQDAARLLDGFLDRFADRATVAALRVERARWRDR